MISLVEHPELTWRARMNFLSAKNCERRIDLYVGDLLWKLVSMRLDSEIPMPSEMWNENRRVDNRTAKEIQNDLLEGLGRIGGE